MSLVGMVGETDKAWRTHRGTCLIRHIGKPVCPAKAGSPRWVLCVPAPRELGANANAMQRKFVGIAIAITMLFPAVASAATLTPIQVSAIIGLLESFGVPQATLTVVYNDLTPPVQTTPTTPVGSSSDNQDVAGSAVLGASSVDAPLPNLDCQLSKTVIPSSSISGFVLLSWDFSQGATGKLTTPHPLQFYRSTDVRTVTMPLTAHSYDMGKVGFQTISLDGLESANTSASLTVSEEGFATTSCSI